MTKKLDKSLRKFNKKKEDKPELFSGELGISLDGRRVVEVPNREGFVFVRLKGNTSELIQAYNATVSPVYGLPVLVGRQGMVYQVVGRNLSRYQNWGRAPFLPKHGFQHSFSPRLNIGGDPTWVYSQQFMPLLSYPSGSVGGMMLGIEPAFYEYGGTWRYAQTTGTPSYASFANLLSGSFGRMILSYIDPADNSVKLMGGGTFDLSITGSAELAQYIPAPLDNTIPLAAVRLVTGMTSIPWSAVYDVREFFHVRSPSTPVGVLGVIPVRDEGVLVGTGTSFNFVGAGVSGSVIAGIITVDVPGLTGKDEGQLLGNPTILNVTGDRLTASISGTTMTIHSSPEPMDNIGVFVLDDGAIIGTGTTLNFQNNLSAARTGTMVFIDAIGGGPGGGGGLGVMGLDEGVPLGTGAILNFTGPGVRASISGTHINVEVARDGWVFIDEVILPWNTGTITFSNIPSVYSQLKLVGLAKTTSAAAIDEMRLMMGNGTIDTSLSYGYVSQSHGLADVTNSENTIGYIGHAGIAGGGTSTPGALGHFTYVIEGYTTGYWKHVFYKAGLISSSENTMSDGYGVWKKGSVVDTIQIRPEVGASSFVSGTYARLYGLLDYQGLAPEYWRIEPTFPEQLGVYALDDGSPIGTGTTLNFGSNLSAIRSGTTLFIDATAGGGGGGIGIVGQDEGIYAATGSILNVTGQRATLTASGTVLNLNISPDPQELIGFYATSQGVPLGTGTRIDVGNNLTASLSGTVLRVDGQAGGGGGGAGVMAWDEGVPLSTGTVFNFVGAGVTATVSGSVVQVSVPFGITFETGTSNHGQSTNRTSAGSFHHHMGKINISHPMKLANVIWDVANANTYTVTMFRGWSTGTAPLVQFGSSGTAGASTLTFSPTTPEPLIMPGNYILLLRSATAATVADNTANSDSVESDFVAWNAVRTLYNTTVDNTFSPAIKLVYYKGRETLT